MLNRDRHDPLDSNDPQPIEPRTALEDVGDVHYSTAGYAVAVEYYRDALVRFGAEQEFDPIVAARLVRKVSDCHRSRGELDEALAVLDRAGGFLTGFEAEPEFGVVLGRRADILGAQGKHDEALRSAERALDVLRATSAHRDYAQVLSVAAASHGRLGDFGRFEQLNHEALATYRRIEDLEGVAEVLNNLGIAYKNACRWDRATGHLQESRDVSLQLGLTRRLARTLGNLGIVLTKTREFDDAIAHLRKARRLASSLGDNQTVASCQNSLGRAYTLVGRYAQAQRCLIEARVLAERHGFQRSLALSDEFLGDLMRAQGRLAEARQNYEAGLRRARALAPRGDVVGEILRRIADLELASGLRSQAVSTARRALKVCEGCSELYEIGYVHRTLGLALAGLGKRREAADALAASVEWFGKTRNPYEQAWSRAHLASVHLGDGSAESRLRAVREAQAAVDTFRDLEEDGGWVEAGLLLARAHRELGSHDEGLLVLYDLERVCEESPGLGSLEAVRTLRREFEAALAERTRNEGHPVQLFGELYALAGTGTEFDARFREVLGSLCARVRGTGAFLAVLGPAAGELQIVAEHGMALGEATCLARFLVADGVRARVQAHVEGTLADAFPALATRAAALLCQPLRIEDRTVGLLYVERARGLGAAGGFAPEEVELLSTYAGLAAVLVHERWRDAFAAGAASGPPADLDPILHRVVTRDPLMFEVLGLAQKVARSSCTVLLSGETGTGKGLLAQCIHELSARRARRFVAINCAALPEPLLESELFGHVRGAFTSADTDKMGLLEAANGGTVFLDEVGKTSLFMQGKLLQFLDSMEVRPVGANEFRKVDVRVVCASKSNLRDLIAEGKFLEDLYYRLNDFPLALPPLRERAGDIRLLAEHALEAHAGVMRKRVPAIARPAWKLLEDYAWPGNVRELDKTIKRAVILVDEGQPITAAQLPEELKPMQSPATEDGDVPSFSTLRESVARTEARVIRAALHRTSGNKAEAARLLAVSYPCLLQKVRTYGLVPEP